MDKIVNRTVYPLLKKSLEEKYISILLGPRQTGKTTLLKKLIEELKDGGTLEKDILFINFDNPVKRAEIIGNPKLFFRELGNAFGEPLDGLSSKKFVFLDEVQKIPQLFDMLKILFDDYPEKIKLVISGSSSLNLLKKSSETLVGRARLYHLTRFSWREIADSLIATDQDSFIGKILETPFSESNYLKAQSSLFRQKELVSRYWDRYLESGGLPEIFFLEKEKKDEALSNYLKIYLEQEIRSLPQIRDENLFLRALNVFLLRDSHILNQSKLASETGISRLTIKNYLDVLEETFLLKPLYPFIADSKQLTKSPKTYFFDHGLVNFSKKIFRLDQLRVSESYGTTFENIAVGNVFSHFANDPQTPSINFWRDYQDREIDLIISDNLKKIIPIEITSSDKIDRQKINNFKAFYKAFHGAQDGFIIWSGEFKKIKIEKKNIYAIPFWMWL